MTVHKKKILRIPHSKCQPSPLSVDKHLRLFAAFMLISCGLSACEASNLTTSNDDNAQNQVRVDQDASTESDSVSTDERMSDATAGRTVEVDVVSDTVPQQQVQDTASDVGRTGLEDVASTPDEPCPGCTGAPCADALDCNSGWCIQGPEGLQCTKLCTEDCPPTFSCREVVQPNGDPVYLCIYDHVHYCSPCTVNSDCWPPLLETSKAECVETDPVDGSFCATPCELDAHCPPGAICELGDDDKGLCKPLNGQCECSAMATAAEAATACYMENEYGTCEGVRQCTDEGLTDCPALVPAPEVCDGVDNDCNGLTDEGLEEVGQTCDGLDDDECEDGVVSCTVDGLVCSDDFASSGELCNDDDDDCDGKIDEDFADKDSVCDGEDADLCSDGIWVCSDDALICSDDEESQPETCNGQDDDCDSEIDETLEEVGQACDGEDDDLCENGSKSCTTEGIICVEDDAANKVELCSGTDEDCDGNIDEDFADKDSTCDGDDADLCADGTWVCDGESLVCNDDDTAHEEVCDNSDDDCDGEVDEAFPLKGSACDNPDDLDFCSDGVWVCDGQGLTCDDDPATNAEWCNDQDDDCDGSIDEGPNYAAKGTKCDGDDDADQCQDGYWVCNELQTGLVCDDDPESKAEICNDADDDCDGNIDETFVLKGGTCDGDLDDDLCQDGQWTCDGEGGLTCNDILPSIIEVCGGGDEDCDGVVDEGFEEVGSACDNPQDDDLCTDGLWACENGGVVCTDDEDSIVESCNDDDDDCDDSVDENFTDKGEACDGDDDDLCTDGQLICSDDGAGTTCDDDEQSVVELCNGEDDDCDDNVDEAFAQKGLACDGADDDSCPDGTFICHDDESSTICDDDAESVIDICNGVDDDCDGEHDEDFVDKGEACDGSDDDLCKGGYRVCSEDGASTTCDDDASSIVELCNDTDDDCDGNVDETFGQKGEGCDGSDDDQCEDGIWVCGDNGDIACNDDAQSIVDLCNEEDDDCDASVDEDFPMLGEACDGSDDDLCTDGVWSCGEDGQAICDDDAESIVDICNEEDDDCDDSVDEDFTDKGDSCDGEDADLCTDGQRICSEDGAGTTCDDDAQAIVDICNDVDDDCDDSVDEDFADKGDACDGSDDDSCTDGQLICSADGGGTTCDDDAEAIIDICNDIDDDCDLNVDEDFADKGDACDGSDDDLCTDGHLVCNQKGTATKCDDDPESVIDICNELDDDCDDSVDEDYPELGTACDGSDSDLCQHGVWFCGDDGQAACDDDAETVIDICNDIDDDCDDSVDEDYPELGAECDGDDDDLCQHGAFVCDAFGDTACDDDAFTVVDMCDGADEDCDGHIDEDYPNLGEACDGPDNDECADGIWVCASGGMDWCDDDDETIVELCNDLDEDCDGSFDEDFPNKGLPCDGNDGDLCEEGVWLCTDDGGIFCDDVTDTIIEICNTVDDNCDGVTDEGCCGAIGEVCCATGQVCQSPFICEGGICACESQASAGCMDGDVWWLDCHGQPSTLKEGCGSCGCLGGSCDHVNPPICAPDQLQYDSEDCGLCGTRTQSQACLQNCEWPGSMGPWGECLNQGVCSPSETQEESRFVSCGNYCGQQQEVRTRTCTSACGWGEWSDWSPFGSCDGEGVCMPNQQEFQNQTPSCGNCGTKSQQNVRTCNSYCGWDGWSGWVDTSGCSDEGVCSPGQQDTNYQNGSCGNCGTKSQENVRTCNSYCGWDGWSGWYDTTSCSAEGACSPGQQETDYQNASCGNCGNKSQQNVRSCNSSCGWDGWSGWYDTTACSGQGSCSAGQAEYDYQTVSCGNCGNKSQQKSRSCHSSCGWDGWSGWYDTSSCNSQGACGPGQVEYNNGSISCGYCGTQQTQSSRSCTSSCNWGGWSGDSYVGSCSGQGGCAPGDSYPETEVYDFPNSCGNCGDETITNTRTVTCDSGCNWSAGGWSSSSSGCTGQGSCSPGESYEETEEVGSYACGNCGTQSVTKSRTVSCDSSCGWSAGSWIEEWGGCAGEGECTPGASDWTFDGYEDCNYNCSNSCVWELNDCWEVCYDPWEYDCW